MKGKRGYILVGLVALALLLSLIAGCAKPAPKGPIKVGIATCLSGPPAVFGNQNVNGFKLAVEEVNSKGGVLGRKIEVVTRDTKFKPDIAMSVAKELVMSEKVDVLAGTINSAAALAISDYCKTEKIPFIVLNSLSEKITGAKGHRYVFSTVPNTAMFGKAQAQFEARQPYTKWWIAGDDYEYGHAIADAFWRNLKALKPEVQLVGQSWWKVGEPDLMPYINAILAAKPDALFFACGGASVTNAMKVSKTTGLAEKMHISMPTAIDTVVISPLGPNAPEGAFGGISYLFYYPDTPANKAFANAFYKAYGEHPGFSAFSGYIAGRFVAEAYKKAGTTDAEKFIDALEGLEIDSRPRPIRRRAPPMRRSSSTLWRGWR